MNLQCQKENTKADRRWYDRQPELSRCVTLLEAFPPEIRTIIADGVVYLAEKEVEAHLLITSLRSLGQEKVLGVYKSKNKRREIDQDPVCHQAMNYFYILSPNNRLFMAKLTVELVGYISQYFEACKIYRQAVSAEEISLLTRNYVEQGGEQAQHFIESLQRQFMRRVENASQARSAGSPQDVYDDGAGMHLRKRH